MPLSDLIPRLIRPIGSIMNTYAISLPYYTLKPRQKKATIDLYTLPTDCTLISGRVWVGHDQGSTFEAGLTVWLRPKTGGNIYLGGVYLHKHYANVSQMDYYHLHELGDIQPISVTAGSQIIVARDMFNISMTKTFNAWDCEILLVIAE